MQNVDPYDALIPVFLETEVPRRLQQVGTAVFVEYQGEPFLYTAAHVTDGLAHGELLIPTSKGLSIIDGYLAYISLPSEIPRSGDVIDIAYYRLSSVFATELCNHFQPLPHSRCDLVTTAEDLTVCSAAGYPTSKGKKGGDGSLSSEIFSFRGVVAGEGIYSGLSLSPEQNIVIHFSKKRAVDRQSGKLYPTPGLKGISGGGIFAWPKGEELSEDWSLPKLVGVVHSFKEREGLIIGTTLLPLIAAIQVGRMKEFGGIR